METVPGYGVPIFPFLYSLGNVMCQPGIMIQARRAIEHEVSRA
jgi:hypothetical protein